MKASKYIVFFSIFSLALPSCGNRWYADDTNNITLTNFTKDLLSVYLNDSLVVNWKERYDEITLICSSDDEHYYLSLHLNESKIYKRYCYESFIGHIPYLGKTSFGGKSVRVFGAENSMFCSVQGNAPEQGRCLLEYWEYDPIEWSLCFNRDSSLCRDATILYSENIDISSVDYLVAKYF